ncbi:hypothetical protein T4B_7511 [Trichinella pseudospiralis]|uniref:Uncharacterized protein n=2 Tax=Trichinella pseudospiralis TaxID=6337 RepID=A0A0V1F9T8_TRIPS|nr:hypothetical protein T4A_2793 [Trichinella pseudospiralis]KRY82855.1 hypothetical protein T4D_2389 [Trichinella pseudospiralis]KRY85825.1 hypothetical protein T4D_4517 [Trichinella pseudospiralis]KRZ22462.1 hypothetical protein T4B_3816 [Trichinella pseudospiralis]KRZ23613.1 hypothetical protein T4B_7511 [Trichinella pseudospiralis]
MDGKQLSTPLWYNLESAIHSPGSHGCQQSNVGTHSKYQYMHCDALCHNKNSPPTFAVLNGTEICKSGRWLGSSGGCTSWTLPI